MPNTLLINHFVQHELARLGCSEAPAVEVARWLEREGLLTDSKLRRGKPLRDLLRAGLIEGGIKIGSNWFIRSTQSPNVESERVVARGPETSLMAPIGSALLSGGEAGAVLPDLLAAGLRLVFVGTVVSDASARRGHYYSGSGNSFYQDLFDSGLTPTRLEPSTYTSLLAYGIGLTDLVKSTHSSQDALLAPDELAAGVDVLYSKLSHFRPSWVCFNGKSAHGHFSGGPSSFGEVPSTIEGCRMFVVPSTSGRVSKDSEFDGRTRGGWFRALAACVQAPHGAASPRAEHYVVPAHAKGWSYRRIYANYLSGSKRIELCDPYIRQAHQFRNLSEFLQLVMELTPEHAGAEVVLLTGWDSEDRARQGRALDSISQTLAGSRVSFSWSCKPSGEVHARSVTMDTGWKVIVDRGLDIFAKCDAGSFAIERTVQELRETKSFEVTSVRL